MTESYYEIQGPNAEFVRNDIYKKYKHYIYESEILTDEYLKRIIQKHIPDTMTNFGSFRGYATFGIDNNIKNNIMNDINNIIMSDVS